VACVYGWGCCSDGRIGPGREESCERPAEIETVTLMLRQLKHKPISVAAGGVHSMAVLDVTREVYLHALHVLVMLACVLALCLYICGCRAAR
jgi:Regulator of chromosome condensation (RCC1) repeat